MDPCFIVVAGVCFAPFRVNEMAYERHYGVEARIEYPDMTAHLVVGDDVQHFDMAQAETVCADGLCVAYHVYCNANAGRDSCLVSLERGREGAISVRVTSSSGPLPTDWMDRLGVLPLGATKPISFLRMRISEEHDWAREPPRRLQ